jgi:hypothetical protein
LAASRERSAWSMQSCRRWRPNRIRPRGGASSQSSEDRKDARPAGRPGR